MPNNKVKDWRERKNITLQQLAAFARISIREIEQVESGSASVSLELAVKIAEALGEPLSTIFPSTRHSLRKLGPSNTLGQFGEMILDQRFQLEMEQAGIKLEPLEHTFQCWFRGGIVREFSLFGPDQEMLARQLMQTEEGAFVPFDSGGRRFVINLQRLLAWKFQSKQAATPHPPSPELGVTPCVLTLFLSGEAQPIEYPIEPDSSSLSQTVLAKELSDPDLLPSQAESQLQELILTLVTLSPQESRTAVVSFREREGDEIYLRASALNLLEVPLSAVDPEYFQKRWEGFGPSVAPGTPFVQ